VLTIGELARLAGTTVRAVRYYHAAGVLAEPRRGTNGYRRYDAGALVRLIRIRRLRELGVPLARVRAVLDAGESFDDVLDAFDAELAARAAEIAGQRARIAGLRGRGADPELPEPLGALFAELTAGSPDASRGAVDRGKATVLLALALAPDAFDDLVELYRRLLGDPALAARMQELDRRFAALADEPAASPAVEALAEAVLDDPDVRAELAAADPDQALDRRALAVLDGHYAGYAPAQRRFLSLVLARAAASIRRNG